MTVEIEETPLKYQFLELQQSKDPNALHEFLDNQNISDVADLINEFPEQEGYILGNLSIHRAISTFKILDFTTQKELPRNFPIQNGRIAQRPSGRYRTSFLEDLPSE
jgi:magnesium transporter